RFPYYAPSTPEIYTLSLHDALPISSPTPSPTPHTGPYGFVLVGDFGTRDASERAVAREAKRWTAGRPLDVVVTLGDNVYETGARSEEHTSELQSRGHLVCRLLLEKK